MNPAYKLIGVAPTLGELRQLLDKAIEFAGENANWNGYDDHRIYTRPVDPSKQCYSIERREHLTLERVLEIESSMQRKLRHDQEVRQEYIAPRTPSRPL